MHTPSAPCTISLGSKRTLMRDEQGEVIHGLRVVRDEVSALKHRLVVREEAVKLHERLDRHNEERVVRLRRHEAGERGAVFVMFLGGNQGIAAKTKKEDDVGGICHGKCWFMAEVVRTFREKMVGVWGWTVMTGERASGGGGCYGVL